MSRISSASFSLTRRASSSSKAPSLGEVAGGTAAECVAICCCGPFGIADLLLLTVYKVPAGLCRAALRRRRREKLLKKGQLLLPSKTSITRRCNCGFEDFGFACNCQSSSKELLLFAEDNNNNNNNNNDNDNDNKNINKQVEDMVRLEKEMWETFYEAGFWRSPSRMEHLPPPPPPQLAPAEADLLLLLL